MVNNKIKCEYSGKAVGNRPVILSRYAVEYVRKLGYLVSNQAFVVFMSMIIISLLLPNVLAFDKYYNSTDKTVIVKNGPITVGTVKLLTPLSNNVLDRGDGIYQKVAELEFDNGISNYGDYFKKWDLYDLKNNNKKLSRDYKIKVKSYEYVNVTQGKHICSDYSYGNGTKYQLCESVYAPDKVIQKAVWTDIGDTKLSKGKITIGIFTDVKKGESIEWIPTIYGDVLVPEWSNWTDSLSNDLILGWNMTEFYNSSEIIDVVNSTWNLTFTGDFISDGNGPFTGSGGYIALEHTDSEWAYGVGKGYHVIDNGNRTIMAWVKFDTTEHSAHAVLIATGNTTNTEAFALTIRQQKYLGFMDGGTRDIQPVAGTDISDNQWHCVGVTYNNGDSNNISLYVDGVITESTTGSALTTSGPLINGISGGWYQSGTEYNGSIDEVYFWSRTLSTAEVQDFCGGMVYDTGTPAGDTTDPTVSLISPIDNYTTNVQQNSFVSNFTDETQLSNATFYIYYPNGSVANTTYNSLTGLQDTTTVIYSIPILGSYEWNYKACDNSSNCIFNTTNYTINYADIEYPTFDNIRDFQQNGNTSFSQSFTGSDDIAISGYSINDSTFVISGAGLITNNTILSTARMYWINITINDTSNKINHTTFFVNVTEYSDTGPQADPTLLTIDYDNNFTAIMFLILFTLAGVLFFFISVTAAGGLMSVLGFVLLFSGFLPILSFIVITLGVLCFFIKK